MIDETFGENFWNTLTKEEQLKCFCAISRRIYKGELEDNGTYRYVLYDVFGFGPESYGVAQLAGYLSIHNVLFEGMYNEQCEELDSDKAIDGMANEMKMEVDKLILDKIFKKLNKKADKK